MTVINDFVLYDEDVAEEEEISRPNIKTNFCGNKSNIVLFLG